LTTGITVSTTTEYEEAHDQLCNQLKNSVLSSILNDNEGLDVFFDVFMTDSSDSNKIMGADTADTNNTTENKLVSGDKIFVQFGFNSKSNICLSGAPTL
jgi:hypothetical protein